MGNVSSGDGALAMVPRPAIESHILVVRERQVMLDEDLAKLYGVETKRLVERVKRNIERFPDDFMFQLTTEEAVALRSQSATSKGRGGRRYAPYAFTEQGVAMLSGVLRSRTAVRVNIEIMRAFVELRRAATSYVEIERRLTELERDSTERLGRHDKQLANSAGSASDRPRATNRQDGEGSERAGHTWFMPAPLIEFPADDPDRALRFWHGVLGVTLAPRTAAAGSGWQTDTDGLRLGVHLRGPGPGDTASLPYFTVADLATTLERVRELGGSIIHPGDRWAVCRDSEGSPFALAAPPAPDE